MSAILSVAKPERTLSCDDSLLPPIASEKHKLKMPRGVLLSLVYYPNAVLTVIYW